MTDEKPDIDEIGPYRITRLLGEGGKGRVYEAEQTSPVRRTVAVKVMRTSAQDANDALRFAAEQQALALMDHPGIAKVFDAGTTEDGRQWFAMELIDGLPLLEFADTHKLDIDTRVELFVRVCRAVQHAHQKGIIHRDLKPSNVLVSKDDGVRRPKVIDFGIAKAMDIPLTDETLLTQFGTIIGTPAYMSPEQAEGTVFAIDTRADVYSLGVMLYELLAGCLPVDPRVVGYPGFIAFLKNPDEEAPEPGKRFAQLSQDQREDIAASRKTDVSRLPAKLSGDLRWIITTALEKEPARRYQSAGALAEDLERLAQGKVVSAAPPGAGYRLRKFVARNRLAVSAAAVVVLALAGGTIAATIGMLRAEREAAVATTVSGFLENVFAEASPFSRSDEGVTARQLLDTAAANIETELAGQPLVQGRLMMSIGASYRGLGLFNEATPLLERALALLREGGATADQIADAEYELGYHLIFMAEFERSRELLNSAIDYYRAEVGHTDERLTIALGDLVFNAYRGGGGIPAAFELLDRELGPAMQALGRSSQAVVQLLYMRCWGLRSLGRAAEALDACEESLDAVRLAYENDAPVLGHNTLALGHTYQALGRFEDALATFRQVLDINRRLYGEDHEEIAWTLTAMAHAHLNLGQREEALATAKDGVAMIERIHDTGSAAYASATSDLALVLIDLRRFEEAEALLDNIIAIDTRVHGSDSARVRNRYSMLAMFRLREGRFVEAEELAAESLEKLQAMGRTGESLLWTRLTLGQSAHRLGKFETAELHLRESYAMLEPAAANRPVHFAESAFLLASLLYDQGNLAEACPMAEIAADKMAAIYGPQSWRPAAAGALAGACEYQDGNESTGLESVNAALQRLENVVLPGDIYLAAATELAASLD